MGDEVEDYVMDLADIMDEKYPKFAEMLRYGHLNYWEVIKYHRWAEDDYGKRALEHPYEVPWKIIRFRVGKTFFESEEIGDDIIVRKIRKFKQMR